MARSMDDVAVFVEIVRQGSLRGAARRLGLSPSAVSKRLAQLEEHLGVVLLERTTRRLRLTQGGEAYYELVHELPEALSSAEDEVRAMAGRVSGVLRVAMPTYFEGARLYDELIPAFCRAHPDVRLDLELAADPLALQAESFDVLIAGRLPQHSFPDSSLKHQRILRMRGALFAAPGYLDRAGRPGHPVELVGHECVVHQNPLWWFVEPDGSHSFHRAEGSIRTNSNQLVRAATRQGLGISYSFPELFADLLASGEVEEVLPDYTREAFVEVHSFHPSVRYLPRRTRAFVDALVRHFDTESRPTSP